MCDGKSEEIKLESCLGSCRAESLPRPQVIVLQKKKGDNGTFPITVNSFNLNGLAVPPLTYAFTNASLPPGHEVKETVLSAYNHRFSPHDSSETLYPLSGCYRHH